MPFDALVVVYANLAKLRNSPYSELIDINAMSPLVASTDEGCGKDLADKVETIAAWELSESGASFGLIAFAKVSEASLPA